ncbi:homoserine dehydrogenase [Powellomyces hirtus]|uniref:Homoserine dehydrogenase n=1 Tax=Powellomyces hirtus TaxID=109895 RepID=A0A507E1I6_9FUNG|nr:homoserine dehydrogenase [Powellomyces hirtus]
MLNLAIIGPGLVGSEFISQVLKSTTRTFRIIAVSNSKRMVLSQTTAPLTNSSWKTQLESPSATPTDLAKLAAHAASQQEPCVVVDCTSSDAVAECYPVWLRMGLHVITPNKKAFSGPLPLWDDIQKAAKEGKAHVFHESTVGAGLPILSTLRDLIETGDDITRIEGIFSGTLSYLFNNFSSPNPPTTPSTFSQTVSTAKSLGYTEPDPRDDLNGMDVARKVVILGRCAGIPLDLTTLHVENMVPEQLRNAPNADAFMQQLPEADAHFAKLNEDARKEQCVLRYVGCVDPNGQSSVKLAKYPLAHPFAALTGSDNVIAFTTRIFPSPLIVQGAGAGAAVTAFGMFCDLLKIDRILSPHA